MRTRPNVLMASEVSSDRAPTGAPRWPPRAAFITRSLRHDRRALQAWLGHKNIQHTVRYTKWGKVIRAANIKPE